MILVVAYIRGHRESALVFKEYWIVVLNVYRLHKIVYSPLFSLYRNFFPDNGMKKSIAILLAIGYQKIVFWHPIRNPYSVIDPKQVLQDIDLKNKFDGHQLV